MRLKCLIFALALVFIGQSLSARVKYDKSMEPFIGEWIRYDELGNYYEYKFQVVDGWVVLRFVYLDKYMQGIGMSASQKKSLDYTYRNGCFYYSDNLPTVDVYNSMTLYLKEGSLVESNKHRHPGTNTTYIHIYEKE